MRFRAHVNVRAITQFINLFFFCTKAIRNERWANAKWETERRTSMLNESSQSNLVLHLGQRLVLHIVQSECTPAGGQPSNQTKSCLLLFLSLFQIYSSLEYIRSCILDNCLSSYCQSAPSLSNSIQPSLYNQNKKRNFFVRIWNKIRFCAMVSQASKTTGKKASNYWLHSANSYIIL